MARSLQFPNGSLATNYASTAMITVESLRFTYPKAGEETLRGIDFTIAEGEIFGFLGPSGAGKSTTQKILIGLLPNYRGVAEVMGREVSAWGQDFYELIGVSFELPNHYLKLTALENLDYFGSLFSNPTTDSMELLKLVGLDADANKRVSEFSKGMKVRLNVARGLLHGPRILFLDEPTSGLDPVNARNIKDVILGLRARGTTVFVTTHNMMVADELCDRVAFITDGSINIVDSPDVLKKRFGKRTVAVEYVDGDTNLKRQEFELDRLGQNPAFVQLLNSAERVETIHSQESTLENIFIQVTGHRLST